MKLLVATTNHHKLREIREMFQMSFLELLSMDEFPSVPEVVEDGETFADNATKKAVELAKATGYWTLADDSGLEVFALDGRPGVRSARYAGEPVNYQANNSLLLKELEGKTNRAARFVCVMALSDPEGYCRTVRGECAGVITTALHGDNGFGYDPVFMPKGCEMTFAEMEAEEKNLMSHRAVAVKKASEEWGELLEKMAGSNCEDGEEFVKVALIETQFQAEIIDGVLEERGIPHIVRSFHSSAFDGLFQMTKGWGQVDAPARHKDEILVIMEDLAKEPPIAQ